MWRHPVFLAAFIGSTLGLGGLCFGFLRTFTALPLWACVSIALPSGALVFMLLLWLGISSDAPTRYQCAAPDGGPAGPLGNSGVRGGPPSVS
jgi:hypothetical protein